MINSAMLEKLKSDGMLLAIIPFLGSLSAFAFETGYLTYFDIPYDVISIGFYRIVAAVLWILAAFCFVWIFAARLIAIFISKNEIIKNTTLFIFLLVLIWVIFSNVNLNHDLIWGIAGAALIPFLSILNFLIGENGYFGKSFSPQLRRVLKEGRDVALQGEKISSIYTVPFTILIIVIGLVGVLGYWMAKLEQPSWVIDELPNYFLVRKYDQTYVFKEYDPKTMNLKDRVQIINISEEKKLILKKYQLKN